MFLTNKDIAAPLSFTNTLGIWAPPSNRVTETSVTNTMPVELSFDITKLLDKVKTQNLIDTLKNAQKIVDEGHDEATLAGATHHGLLYHSFAGLVHPSETAALRESDLIDLTDPAFHTVSLSTYKVAGKIAYCFDHALYDSFGLYSTLADILQIDVEELYFPNNIKLIDIIHIKSFTTPPYKPTTLLENTDKVICQLSLNGETTLWAKTSPRNSNVENYSKELSSTKLTAFNPYILDARTTETEDTYILNIRFNSMTFTRLLELANSK